MARVFDDASSQYLEATGLGPQLSYPFTISFWGYSDDEDATQSGVFFGDDDSTSPNQKYTFLGFFGGVAGDPLRFQMRNDNGGPNTTKNADTTSGYSSNTWHHCCAVGVGATDRRVFIDGGSKGTSTDSLTVGTGIDMRIGAFETGAGLGNFWSGRIAECAVWLGVALSDAEVALLSKGFSPLLFHPHALEFYMPLYNSADEDIVGSRSLTATNSPTLGDHPLIIYPSNMLHGVDGSSGGANFWSGFSDWF